jgi:L-alanine-DL-glutamate epimerase-like enolase superfamily enzyme
MRYSAKCCFILVKTKIGGASLGEDLGRIDAVLDAVGDGKALAVDANGRFDLETALAYANAISKYNLFWHEERGDALDHELLGHA